MRYRKLSSDGDYTFGNGQLDFYRDVPEAVAQAVKTRLDLWLGEWFLNIASGTAYILGVLGKHSQEEADNVILTRANGTQGVTVISDFESVLDRETRAYSATFKVDTVYGPTQVEIENYVNY